MDENCGYIILLSRLNDLLIGKYDGLFCEFYLEDPEYAQRIADTRHYYTHYGKSKEEKAFKGDQLNEAITIMALLLEYNICLKLDIDIRNRIYLLHGLLDNHSNWIRGSMAEEYAEQHKLALVMPSGQNSFYVNAVYGPKFFDFINKELPMWAEANFPILSGRENRFIAGLSMGGYGALRHGLTTPDKYTAIGAFSPACDLMGIHDFFTSSGLNEIVSFTNIFGDLACIRGSDNDLKYLMKKCKSVTGELPPIYIGCGTSDPVVYTMCQELASELKREGYNLIYREMNGAHEWKVWNACLWEFMEMIAPISEVR